MSLFNWISRLLRQLKQGRRMKKERNQEEVHLLENDQSHQEKRRVKKRQTCHHLQRRTLNWREEEMLRIPLRLLVSWISKLILEMEGFSFLCGLDIYILVIFCHYIDFIIVLDTNMAARQYTSEIAVLVDNL